MNELRWIILGIGVLIIVAIYLWESWKQKRQLRSRVENYPGSTGDSYANIQISPKNEIHREKELDLSAAADAFNSYLKQSRDVTDSENLQETTVTRGGEPEVADEPDLDAETSRTDAVLDETIIVIYIVDRAGSGFSGAEIQKVLEETGLQYGDMKIFHYRGHGEEFKQRSLFSVANIHEPGIFDIDNMASMQTDGLAMFMCLPVPIGGDIAFEIMLDCAQKIADRLGGELRNEKHDTLDVDAINRLRETAGRY